MARKPRVAVYLRDKTEIRGYISQAGEDTFVVRDNLANAERTVAYRDVDRVKGLGMSTGTKITIAAVISVAVVLTFVAIYFRDS